MPKSSLNKSHNNYLNTQSGIMPLNSYQALLVHCQNAYCPLLKKKLQKQRCLLKNICDVIQSNPLGVPMQPTSSL